MFRSCFKTFFICTFNARLLFTFYLNGGLHAVSMGKASDGMSKFWTVPFLKTESEKSFGFPHIPTYEITSVEIFRRRLHP